MRKKTCVICGKKELKSEMSFVRKSNAYICEHCKEVKGYSWREFKTIESISSNDSLKRSVGFELEVVGPTDYAILELIKRGFNSTHDGTVDIEFKSPIYKSKDKLVKDIMFIDKLVQDKEIRIDSSCGTHVRIGNVKSSSVNMEKVKEAIACISTDPFYLWIFGRSTCGYANLNLYERTCMINTSNISKYNAIEYRLPRFRTKKRFCNLLDFLLSLTDAICNADIDIYNLCYNYRKHNIDGFKAANFKYYQNKVSDLKLNANINISDYLEDFIDDELCIYDSLDELQDYTTCTISDLLEFFSTCDRLDDINCYHFVYYDNELVHCYRYYEDLKDWVSTEFEDIIRENYVDDDIIVIDNDLLKKQYEDIKNDIAFNSYINKYCR